MAIKFVVAFMAVMFIVQEMFIFVNARGWKVDEAKCNKLCNPPNESDLECHRCCNTGYRFDRYPSAHCQGGKCLCGS